MAGLDPAISRRVCGFMEMPGLSPGMTALA
jgi:hypothetical protein